MITVYTSKLAVKMPIGSCGNNSVEIKCVNVLDQNLWKKKELSRESNVV